MPPKNAKEIEPMFATPHVLLGFSDRRSFLLAMCLGLLSSQGCAMLQRASVPTQPGTAKPTIKKSPPMQAKLPQTGKASWYGPQHQGKRTASGEIFDHRLFTAAHPTLPFGTKIKVTNLANGKSVEVKINDRGPFIDNRIIDLSLGAAKALEMMETGTARVRLDASSDP
jgi:rare lipoprotein A (peptidoglycan hydrolase)